MDATARIQSNSGLVTATSSFTASLPNPTSGTSTLLLFVATSSTGSVNLATAFDPPFFGDATRAGAEYVWRRDNQPAGETSWVIPTSATSNNYYWRVEEWSGLSSIGQPDANTAIFLAALGTSPVSTNTATADVDDFAALAIFVARGPGGITWPGARSYSSGWSEVDYLPNGTGAASSDFALVIAESYPGASGSVQATITWDISGSGSVPSTDAWVACYQPDVPAPAAGVLTG